MNEIWKDIKGYEGFYQVSNLGRVKSLSRAVKVGIKNVDYATKSEKILKPYKNCNGYFLVKLCLNKNDKQYQVHRLVAEAFIDNPNNLSQVNHKDKIKTNNRVDNLEWCTNEYNSRYSSAIHIMQYDLNDNFIKEWDCMNEASKKLNIHQSSISLCCVGKRNKAGGFKWEYKKEA